MHPRKWKRFHLVFRQTNKNNGFFAHSPQSPRKALKTGLESLPVALVASDHPLDFVCLHDDSPARFQESYLSPCGFALWAHRPQPPWESD